MVTFFNHRDLKLTGKASVWWNCYAELIMKKVVIGTFCPSLPSKQMLSYPFFHFVLCCVHMAFFQYGPFFRRFPFFAFGVLMGFFHKIVFFCFFDEKCALRTCGVFMAFCDFRTQNWCLPLFFCGALWRLL